MNKHPIDGPGKYQMRDGREVYLTPTTTDDHWYTDNGFVWQGFPPENSGRRLTWKPDGSYWFFGQEDRCDIVGKVAEPEERLTAREVMERWQSFAQPIDLTPPEKPMTKPFDPSKPVQTRDGRKARIIATDRQGHEPLIALVTEPQGHECIYAFQPSGVCHPRAPGHADDLVNIVEKHVRWINIYNGGCSVPHKTKPEADLNAAGSRIACLRVEFEEGEGL